MKMKKIGPRMGTHIPGAPLDLPTLHMLCTNSDNKKDGFFDWIYDAFKIFSLLQVITARIEVGARLFSQACVILFTGGVSASVHAGIPPPQSRHPPRADTHTPPEQTPPQSRPPSEQTPPRRRACWEIRSTRGRYASYWNAILFLDQISISCSP